MVGYAVHTVCVVRYAQHTIPIIRDGLKQILAETDDLRVLGEAANGQEVLQQVRTMQEEHQYAVRAFKAGALGYLTKNSAASQLVTAVRKVAGGGAYVKPGPGLTKMALDLIPSTDELPHTLLSDREYHIFQLIVSDKTISEIAQQLSISVKTVSTHKSRIMEKMHMTNHAELIRYALQHQLIDESTTLMTEKIKQLPTW